MFIIDTGTAEKLLYLGIGLIIAAIVGGGLDAAGVITLPPLRNWKTQAGVAAIGAVVMSLALVGLIQAGNAAASSAWDAQMSSLAQGTVGIPAPALKPDFIRFELVELLSSAGDDYHKNCSVAAFIVEFSDRLDYVPQAVTVRMLHPLGTQSDVCYQESLAAAEQLQTEASRKGSSTAAPVGELDLPVPLLASRDLGIALEALRPTKTNVDEIQVATTSAARLLESLTAVGDEGYVYLGDEDGAVLGSNRTIDENTAAAGKTATVRVLLNLRAIGNDSDYRNHSVYRVLAPGTRVTIERLTPVTAQHLWARVRVVSLPRS